MGNITPIRPLAPVSDVLSLYGGEHLAGRKAEAIKLIADITALEWAMANYKTLLLERVRRDGFSYSDEADALCEVRERIERVFGELS